MTSYQITITPSKRAAGRLVSRVRREIQKALAEEEKKKGITQSDIARAIGVNRSVISREIRGHRDITLSRVAEIAWAMGRKAVFGLPEIVAVIRPLVERRQASRSDVMLNWPKHLNLSLNHNEHLVVYETVAEAVANGNHGYKPSQWVSPEQMRKAIATNDCWTLQWYPETPVGFCLLSAADLDVLLVAANAPESAT